MGDNSFGGSFLWGIIPLGSFLWGIYNGIIPNNYISKSFGIISLGSFLWIFLPLGSFSLWYAGIIPFYIFLGSVWDTRWDHSFGIIPLGDHSFGGSFLWGIIPLGDHSFGGSFLWGIIPLGDHSFGGSFLWGIIPLGDHSLKGSAGIIPLKRIGASKGIIPLGSFLLGPLGSFPWAKLGIRVNPLLRIIPLGSFLWGIIPLGDHSFGGSFLWGGIPLGDHSFGGSFLWGIISSGIVWSFLWGIIPLGDHS